MKPFHVPASCAFLLLTSSCQTSRYYDARYVKMPIEQEVHADAVPGSQVRALVTILGVARADPTVGQLKQVEIRMRFENLGTIPATLIESSLSLLSADLIPFGPARLANTDLLVPPGQARQYDVAFPAPPNEVDWTTLTLRFGLQFDSTPVITGATFTRLTYYPSYDPYWHVGVGYGYCW